MKFTATQIKIKSSWLYWQQPIFDKIDYDHLYTYINLYKFKINQGESQDTFVTSLGYLRKETGYKTEQIFNILKDLHKYNIIKVDVSRWDYFIVKDDKSSNNNKKVKYNDNAIFMAYTLDKPETERIWNNSKSKYEDQPVTDDDHYISINTGVIEYYRQLHNEIKISKLKPDRLLTFYCILNKHNKNVENKSNMSIYKMSKAIGFSKTLVNGMIEQMNTYGLLNSRKVTTDMHRDGFEHVLAQNLDMINEFRNEVENNPNKYQKNILKNQNKDNDNVSDESETNTSNLEEKSTQQHTELNEETNGLDWGQSPDNDNEFIVDLDNTNHNYNPFMEYY